MASFGRDIILTSSPDQPIAAYDPHSGAMLAQFSGSQSPRRGLCLIGTAHIAASHISATASSGFVRLYNWWSSAAFQSILVPEPVVPIVSTMDGSHLFSGGLSGHVHTHSLPSGDLCRSFRAHGQPVSCLATNGDDADSTKLVLYRLNAHSSSVTAIASSGCSSTIGSSSLDGTCKFWSVADGSHLRTIHFPCAMWCIAIDPTYTAAYAGGSDGRVHVIRLKVRGRRAGGNEAAVREWGAEESGSVVAVAMANGNQNLVSASEDGIVRIWDVENGFIVRDFGHQRGSVSDLMVAKGVVEAGSDQIRGIGTNGETSSGFCAKEIGRNVGEVEEMEKWLGVVAKDRRRAIDMLEAAIGTYEKLLALLLKEAKGGGDGEEDI